MYYKYNLYIFFSIQNSKAINKPLVDSNFSGGSTEPIRHNNSVSFSIRSGVQPKNLHVFIAKALSGKDVHLNESIVFVLSNYIVYLAIKPVITDSYYRIHDIVRWAVVRCYDRTIQFSVVMGTLYGVLGVAIFL